MSMPGGYGVQGSPGQGDLGAVYVNIIPSAAGQTGPLTQAAAAGAETYAKQFSATLSKSMPAVMQTVTKEMVAAQQAAMSALQSQMSGMAAAVTSYSRQVAEGLAAITKGQAAAASAVSRRFAEESKSVNAASSAWFSYYKQLTEGAVALERAHSVAVNATSRRFGEESKSVNAGLSAWTSYKQQLTRGSEDIARAQSVSANATARRYAEESKAMNAGLAALTSYSRQVAAVEGERIAAQSRMTQGFQNLFSGSARFSQMADTWKAEFAKGGSTASSAFKEEAEKGFSAWGPQLLNSIGGPLKLIAPLFQSQSIQIGKMWKSSMTEAAEAAGKKGVVPIWEDALSLMSQKTEAWAGAMKLAMKATMIGAVIAGADTAIKDVHNIVETVGKEFAAFGKVGKDAADSLMGSFSSVVRGEVPDVMGAFNVIEEGFKALWEAPQNMFNLFLQNTIGHIPLIGSAVIGTVEQIESAINSVFPLFDEFKELGGQFISIMVDIGSQWQEIGRTIAGQTLGGDELQYYLGVTKEIAESGLVLHFKDVAQVVGELSQRLDGLNGNMGLTREQLKELATTVAEGNELLGNIKINIDGLTAAFNSFGVSAQDTSELLTEFVNISRRTGADINSVIHDVEASGPAFQDLGFNIEETYFLMARFNEELGSPAMQRFVLSLRGMPEAFSKLQIDPKKGYADLVKNIQELTKPGSSALDLENALNEATRFMSKSAASTFVQGIKLGFSGTPEEIAAALEKWKNGAHSIKQPLEEALESTKSIKDTLETISTQFMGAFGPLAKELADTLKDTGNEVTTWIKTHQDEIIGWAGSAMHTTLEVVSAVIRGMGATLQAAGTFVDIFVKATMTPLLAVEVTMRKILEVMGSIPNWAYDLAFPAQSALAGGNMGGFSKDAAAGLGDIEPTLKAILKEDISGDMGGVGEAIKRMSDTINNQWIPATDKLAHSAEQAAKFQMALQENITKPGQKDPSLQSVLSGTGSETYTAPAGHEDELAKIADAVKDLKDVTVSRGPNGVTLSGTTESLNTAGERLRDMTTAGTLFRGQYQEKDLKLLGDAHQWEDVKNKFHALGIDMDVDMGTGIIKGVKAGTEKAGKDFLQWWQDTMGDLPPIVAHITVEGTGATIPLPTPEQHAAGGSVGSDGWVRGSWAQGQDSVRHPMPGGSYVIRRTQAQKYAGLLDRLYPAGGRGSGRGSGTVDSVLEVGERVMPPGGPKRLYDAINYGYQGGGEVAFPEGPDYYAEAYRRNSNFAFPSTTNYQTPLSPDEERQFQAWVQAKQAPFDPNAATVDYDMRGYWKSYGGNPPWKGPGSHFEDTWKTPYDTTFSAESRYAMPGMPLVWQGDDLVDTRTGKPVHYQRGGPAHFDGGGSPDDQILPGFIRGIAKGLGVTIPKDKKDQLDVQLPSSVGAAGDTVVPGRSPTATNFPSPGAGAESWRSKVRELIASYGPQLGIPTAAYTDWENRVVRQIQTESSGNPNVGANTSDSNAIAGHPSIGLLQFIPSTYAAHNITGRPFPDPIGEIVATLDYAPRTKDGFPKGGAGGSIGEGHGFAGGGLVGFAHGGSASGVDEVIWDDSERGGPTIGEANGQWVGTPGSSDPGYYHRPGMKNDFLDHHGHVHTTFTKNPYTGAPYNEVRAGTDIRQGAAGFPPWVYQLGSQFHVRPSTYSGHQEWDGINHGIDWWPMDAANMSGAGYSGEDRATLTGFAQSVGTLGVGGGTGGGGDRWGNPGGAALGYGSNWSTNGGDSPDPQRQRKAPRVHEHAPSAEGGGAPTGSGPGTEGLPEGLLPVFNEDLRGGANPYTNLPAGMQAGDNDAYKKYKHEYDAFLLRRLDHAQAALQSDEQSAKAASDLKDAQEAERSAHDDWTKILTENVGDVQHHPETYKLYPQYTKWKDKEKEVAEKQAALDHDQATAASRALSEQVEDEAPAPGGPKEGRGGGENKYGSMAEQLGGGLVKGIGEELGFKDVFKGKPFWEWGIWKLGAGVASYGLGILNAIGDAKGGGSGLGGLLGGLANGAATGDLGLPGGTPDSGSPNTGQDSTPGPGGTPAGSGLGAAAAAALPGALKPWWKPGTPGGSAPAPAGPVTAAGTPHPGSRIVFNPKLGTWQIAKGQPGEGTSLGRNPDPSYIKVPFSPENEPGHAPQAPETHPPVTQPGQAPPATSFPGATGRDDDNPPPPLVTGPQNPFPQRVGGGGLAGPGGPMGAGDALFGAGSSGGGGGILGGLTASAPSALAHMVTKYMFGSQGMAGAMRSASPAVYNDTGSKTAGGSLTVNNTYQGFNPTPQIQNQIRDIANTSPGYHLSELPAAVR